MKKILLMMLMLFALPMSGMCSDPEAEADEVLLIRQLLKLDSEQYDAVTESKKWQSLYGAYSKYDQKNKTLTYDEAKILMLIAFISVSHNDTATSQALTRDLAPLFQQNKNVMVSALGELNFLVRPTCYFLNAYFDMNKTQSKFEAGFLKEIKPLLEKNLSTGAANACLSEFSENR